jgi:hypothetical protein
MYGFGEYLNTPGASLPGPGTRLVEHWGGHTGFGDYVPTDNYFLTPAGQAGIRGLGCACAGMVGCNCGMGLFDAGMDFSQWGPGEWAVVVVGAYVLFSTVWTTGQAASYAKRIPGERRKKKAAYYRKKAQEVMKK